MDIIVFENFIAEINNVKDYIKHIELTTKVEINNRGSTENSFINFSNHLRGFGKSKKLFEYKTIVVSLYGILENYISICIREHIDTVSKIINDYSHLPDKIQTHHFALSIGLISMIIENKNAKYGHLKKETVLSILNSCISNPSNYKLNSDAFLPKSGNLKHSKIVDVFKKLEIELQRKFKTNPQLLTFLSKIFGDGIANKGDELFRTIDDLVERRNDIAHGVHIDNILNITEFEDYINFLESYGKALFEIIIEKEIQYEANNLFNKIERVHEVIHHGTVLCFEIENNTIKVGDFVIIEKPDETFLKSKILEIQHNKVNVSKIETKGRLDIGIKLDAKITKNQIFYIKKASLN
jgi:hypothetical protein